jgi:prephenate dehydratase
LKAVAQSEVQLAVVPVENSIEGAVAMTLDTLWQLDQLQIQWAMVLPIVHALVSYAPNLAAIQTVCSHPQALGQCQNWLEQFLPTVSLMPMNSTTESLNQLELDPTLAAITSPRAAELYNLPILVSPINDHPDNCTRFWIVGTEQTAALLGNAMTLLPKTHTSLAFSTPANVPGALVKPLQVFADRGINLSRIESRPSKRSLGDYLFFVDLEGDAHEPTVAAALSELTAYTETLKLFGSYAVLAI